MVKKPTILRIRLARTKPLRYAGNLLIVEYEGLSLFPYENIVLLLDLEKQLSVIMIIGSDSIFPPKRVTIKLFMVTIKLPRIQVKAANLVRFAIQIVFVKRHKV